MLDLFLSKAKDNQQILDFLFKCIQTLSFLSPTGHFLTYFTNNDSKSTTFACLSFWDFVYKFNQTGYCKQHSKQLNQYIASFKYDTSPLIISTLKHGKENLIQLTFDKLKNTPSFSNNVINALITICYDKSEIVISSETFMGLVTSCSDEIKLDESNQENLFRAACYAYQKYPAFMNILIEKIDLNNLTTALITICYSYNTKKSTLLYETFMNLVIKWSNKIKLDETNKDYGNILLAAVLSIPPVLNC